LQARFFNFLTGAVGEINAFRVREGEQFSFIFDRGAHLKEKRVLAVFVRAALAVPVETLAREKI
jgi:hypothetical protein